MSPRTVTCSRVMRDGRMRKAEQFLEWAENLRALVEAEDDYVDAYVTMCVHAGIAGTLRDYCEPLTTRLPKCCDMWVPGASVVHDADKEQDLRPRFQPLGVGSTPPCSRLLGAPDVPGGRRRACGDRGSGRAVPPDRGARRGRPAGGGVVRGIDRGGRASADQRTFAGMNRRRCTAFPVDRLHGRMSDAQAYGTCPYVSEFCRPLRRTVRPARVDRRCAGR